MCHVNIYRPCGECKALKERWQEKLRLLPLTITEMFPWGIDHLASKCSLLFVVNNKEIIY